MSNYEFWVKHGENEDRILRWVIAAFFFILVGVAFGYAWAINAYGIQL